MLSRTLAKFVPFVLLTASLAHASKTVTGDCCPANCSNSCVARPACPCPPNNSCVAKCGDCNPNGCCHVGVAQPPAAPVTTQETPAARVKAAPQTPTANVPARRRVASQPPAKTAAKSTLAASETLQSKTSNAATANHETPPAAQPLEPVVEKNVEKTVEQDGEKQSDEQQSTPPATLRPMTAEELSMPPLGTPLPAVRAGVVESKKPRALFVTHTSGTNVGPSQPSKAPHSKDSSAEKRVILRSSRTTSETGVPNVKPISEIITPGNPMPAPIVPDYTTIRSK